MSEKSDDDCPVVNFQIKSFFYNKGEAIPNFDSVIKMLNKHYGGNAANQAWLVPTKENLQYQIDKAFEKNPDWERVLCFYLDIK